MSVLPDSIFRSEGEIPKSNLCFSTVVHEDTCAAVVKAPGPVICYKPENQSFSPFPPRIFAVHFSTLDDRVTDCLGAAK